MLYLNCPEFGQTYLPAHKDTSTGCEGERRGPTLAWGPSGGRHLRGFRERSVLLAGGGVEERREGERERNTDREKERARMGEGKRGREREGGRGERENGRGK